MYALNLSEDNRILSVTYDEFAPAEQPRVETYPIGNVNDYKYENGEIIYDPLPKKTDNSIKIAEIKQKLADTDYIVIKIAEGVDTWENYPGIKEQRQMWRDEINSLQ